MALQSTTALATVTLQSTSQTVTFSGIPNTYRDLILVIDGATSASMRPTMRLNGDSGSNYTAVMAASDSGSTFSTTSSGTFIDPIPGYSITDRFSQIWHILDASATNKHKTILIRTNQHSGSHVHMTAGRYASTTEVSSITILSNTSNTYAAGTTFSLYGRIA